MVIWARSSGHLKAKYGPWAIVTGASSGIGREYAFELARNGLNVVLVARRRQVLNALAEVLCNLAKVEARVVAVDLSTSDAVSEIALRTFDLDIGLLVNNAGAAQYGSFLRDSFQFHAQVLNVNVVTPIALARYIGGRLCARRRGGIIFTSSTAAALIPYFATYASSKSCISNFAHLIGFEMRPFGVDVLCVEPGFVETEMGLLMVRDIDIRRLSHGVRPVSATRVAQEALGKLGVASILTPGWFPRMANAIVRLLPVDVRLRLFGGQIRKVMSAELRDELVPAE